MEQKYKDIILQVVDNKIESIINRKHVIAGHNGPYYDVETNVRNIAHWISLCSCCFKITQDEKYKLAVQILSEDLYNSEYLKTNFVYISRISTKDSINGTVGLAWIIEGLVAAAEILKDEKYYVLAKKVFFSQKYKKMNHLWSRIDENNEDLGLDLTYNHELWFAAAGAILIGYRYDKIIDEEIDGFLNMSIKGMRVLPDGIINHYVDTWVGIKRTLSFNARYIQKIVYDEFSKPTMRYKEEGYHFFSMYAFALLQEKYSSHRFFETHKFKKALRITFSGELLDRLENTESNLDVTMIKKDNVAKKINAYGYPYNAPGFELPYISKAFAGYDENNVAQRAFEKQLELTYDSTKREFNKNTEDSMVLTARLYELTRALL